MDKYGTIAIRATEMYHSNPIDIALAWKQAAIEAFPTQEASRVKSCPRAAYLGLCEEGRVKGVPKGKYLKREGSLNKEYAIQAIDFLIELNVQNMSPSTLWKKIMRGIQKTSNSQMDVVLSLWESDLINK